MDEITRKVTEMYKRFPYPSPSTEPKKTNELLNLLRIFTMESNYDMKQKKILDAGTGTGHRLIQAASFYKESHFTAIDNSNRSIQVAKELAKKNDLNNIDFKVLNLMDKLHLNDKFDIVLCMGVLHHLSNPRTGLENLLKILSNNGILFLYLYGKLGGQQRLIRKKIVSLLLGKNPDYKKAIQLVRDLQFNNFEYGWNIDFNGKEEEESLIVDAFLHVHEKLYNVNDIDSLLNSSGLYAYSIFGITTEKKGLLFDSQLHENRRLSIPYTDIEKLLPSSLAKNLYTKLDVKERTQLLDLLYQPNGYTVMGFTKNAYDLLLSKRIINNCILC